ncbi:MAG: hypothetical protein CO030_00100 [Candidatus Magasanikbacteria bacterium CG_4_9_14_0_2_um_filter_42_11]|uniref:DUF559 domain-containing protein n=1 Tax=Candidatus Magasanikbacteria bacterium CG_4_9_14_0_2_um_filter_42_11 TaxID=1974643 RepID=A0A2M8FB68_9BACT|nr:MAG: hypothetical protein COU34_01430 [Candidatus Magasanikbacteria bacterium CG10_big_fil_rev_8_21_14_0_10_43_9]PIY92051.1 MAG: hypothetical protein COY70_05260 [Candidatus Magasanikbacteria bacterium CG_4_10_14_0_8_um_filter_42_12]PJC52970.1 MAG: hypothetical protein CO030_00100 [Candidatus Magasanikbacteria bacterium CG_4_9_14_0_2_um_filter_42_11]
MRTSYKEYKELINERAKKLRINPTLPEDTLWGHLRRRSFMNLKFLRQHPILHLQKQQVHFFIADFCCHEYKLIIEVDGDIHNKEEQKEYDVMRTETLEELGYHIVRFTNNDVIHNIEDVMKKLENFISRLQRNPT